MIRHIVILNFIKDSEKIIWDCLRKSRASIRIKMNIFQLAIIHPFFFEVLRDLPCSIIEINLNK